MAENNIIPPEELEFHVQSLKKLQVVDIGTAQWMQLHEFIIKLYRQAFLEAISNQEEVVKDLLVSHNKLSVLIYDAYSVLIWRTKILPKLLELNRNPKASFMIYTVLFHECQTVSLLQTVLYHESGCEALHPVIIDTIDYAVQAITQLIGLTNDGHQRDSVETILTESVEEELQRQVRDMQYKNGLTCLVMLSYIVDKAETLPVSALRRLVVTHDTPYLMSDILHCKPWLRSGKKGTEKYVDNSWKLVNGSELLKVTKVEAQCWFCLRQILLNGKMRNYYEINDFRQRELGKCQALMTEVLLDQLPPLNELKHLLCTLTVSGTKIKNGVFIEEQPEILNDLMIKAKRTGFKEITKLHAKVFTDEEGVEEIFNAAKRLQQIYNIDQLVELEEQSKDRKLCGLCEKKAEKKCSQCNRIYYCCRECQVKDWPQHKSDCERKM